MHDERLHGDPDEDELWLTAYINGLHDFDYTEVGGAPDAWIRDDTDCTAEQWEAKVDALLEEMERHDTKS